MSNVLLQCQNVSARYGAFRALKDVSLTSRKARLLRFSATMGLENRRCCDAVLVRIGTLLAK